MVSWLTMLTSRVAGAVVLVVIAGCAKANVAPPPSGSGGSAGAHGTGGGSGNGSGGHTGAPCMGLRCQQTTCGTQAGCQVPACTGGGQTTVSGTAYDPAGQVPLYNVSVYVPNAPLASLADGASCLSCDTALSGDPITQATTDASGHFVLENVPVGDNIPLVIQIGKWRRQTTIPTVAACLETAITDPNVTRLPRNQSEGHIPKIALTTGGFDALECLLRKIGIADQEFTLPTDVGRVNLYAGGLHNGVPMMMDPTSTTAGTSSYAPTLNSGASFPDAEGWWDSAANLEAYDILLHSCDGAENPTNKSAAALQAFQDYANMGGRTFASHWQGYWIESGPPPFSTVAVFNHQPKPASPLTASIDTTFTKGMDLATWLLNVNGSTTLGQLVIQGPANTVQSVNMPVAQQWIYTTTPASIQYFSFATPVNVTNGDPQCGKVVFSDLHVSTGSGAATDDKSNPNLPFPTGCVTTTLSPQEKALEFMLFDLSACTNPVIP
jgi:hypothetical protein